MDQAVEGGRMIMFTLTSVTLVKAFKGKQKGQCGGLLSRAHLVFFRAVIFHLLVTISERTSWIIFSLLHTTDSVGCLTPYFKPIF